MENSKFKYLTKRCSKHKFKRTFITQINVEFPEIVVIVAACELAYFYWTNNLANALNPKLNNLAKGVRNNEYLKKSEKINTYRGRPDSRN